MSQIVLFYPNASWRANIGDLASKEDKAFNWFLCAKRYKDPKSGLYIAEISKKTKFYDKTTGATLVPSPDLDDPPKLLIVDDSENNVDLGTVSDIIKKYNYQGTTSTKVCHKSRSKTTPCDEDFLCQEASFEFLPGILILSTKERTCPIIDYAKRNHNAIRKHIQNFPSPAEIDEVLEIYQCSTVCRVLYQDLSEYFRRSKKFV